MNKFTSLLFFRPTDKIEDKRIIYFTRTIILVTIMISLILSIIKIILPPEINASDYIVWLFSGLFVLYLFILKAGKVILAANLYVYTFWGSMTILAWSFEGVRDISIVAYLVIILIAIHISKLWNALFISLISIIALWVIYYAETNHIINIKLDTSLNYSIEFTVLMIIVLALAFH